MENLNESLNENLNESLNKNLNENLANESSKNENENLTNDEEIKCEKVKTTELIPQLALTPLIISGIAAAATTGGVIADKVLEVKKIEEQERHIRALETIEKAKSSLK